MNPNRIRNVCVGVAGLFLTFGYASSWGNVIAVSLDDLANFSVSGFTLSVLGAPGRSTGATNAAFLATSVSNSADCPAPPGPCNPGGLTGNPVQSTAGPGPFPGEDDFTQPPAGGFVGSRGDGNTGLLEAPSSPSAMLSQNVAESRLDTAGTAGGATGSSETFETITINGGPFESTPLTFSFTADPFLQVSVGGAGDNAAAILQTSLSLLDVTGATVFQYVPGSSGIGIASELTPFSLNGALMASSPAQNTTFDPSSATFSVTTVNLSPGTYTLTLHTVSTVRAEIGAVVPVPAPPTLVLVGLGLLLAALFRRRARP